MDYLKRASGISKTSFDAGDFLAVLIVIKGRPR